MISVEIERKVKYFQRFGNILKRPAKLLESKFKTIDFALMKKRLRFGTYIRRISLPLKSSERSGRTTTHANGMRAIRFKNNDIKNSRISIKWIIILLIYIVY